MGDLGAATAPFVRSAADTTSNRPAGAPASSMSLPPALARSCFRSSLMAVCSDEREQAARAARPAAASVSQMECLILIYTPVIRIGASPIGEPRRCGNSQDGGSGPSSAVPGGYTRDDRKLRV